MSDTQLWEYAIAKYGKHGLWIGRRQLTGTIEIRKHGWLLETLTRE